VSKKPAAKGKKKGTAKPAKEKKKKPPKASVVKNSTISISKMTNDPTISMMTHQLVFLKWPRNYHLSLPIC